MISVVSIALYLLAGIALVVSIYSKTWPSTKGRLIDAHVEPDRSGGTYSESPSFLYEFTVRDRTYRSSFIRPSGDFSWSSTIPGISSARAQIDEIINLGELTVYYCPVFPRFACLRPGGYAAAIFLSVVATICVVLHAYFP
jgi:hypothetical protein